METAPIGILEPVTENKTSLAPQYRVLIHNDSKTTMDVVILVLTSFFGKALQEAITIMMEAHETGVALVAVLPFEQAEFKIDQAHSKARAVPCPLTLTMEPA